jgi:hypothetical protein
MDREFQAEMTPPQAGEKLTSATLVVGGTLAAYTATLAALCAGERVCWVTPDDPSVLSRSYAQALLSQESPLLSRRGYRHRLAGTQFAMSASQRQWRERLLRSRDTPSSTSTSEMGAAASAQPGQEKAASENLQAYLHSKQLTIVTYARPLWVLYKTDRGRRQLTQVVFCYRKQSHRFTVQAGVAIDGTRTGDLRRLVQLEASSAKEVLTPVADLFMLKAEDVLASHQPRRQARGRCFDDSIGIGHVARVPMPAPESAAQVEPLQVLPFTLPVGALLQPQTQGLILAGPNLAVEDEILSVLQAPSLEWTTGEAAGHLAAFANKQRLSPVETVSDPLRLRQFQVSLTRRGIPLFWFDDVAQDDPDFEAIQMLAVADVMRTTSARDLRFRPALPVSRAVLASAVVRLMSALEPLQLVPQDSKEADLEDVPTQHWARKAICTTMAQGWMLPLRSRLRFQPSRVVTHVQLQTVLERVAQEYVPTLYNETAVNERPVKRRELARFLYRIYRLRLGI